MRFVKFLTKLAFALLLAMAILFISRFWFLGPLTRAQGIDDISVNKKLGRSDPTVFVGEYLTFTIDIVNNSPFTVTTLPLTDDYNASVLGFADAVPPPNDIDASVGQLDWSDLTETFGDLAPGQSVRVVVGFIAEHPEPAIVNHAEVHDAEGTGGDLGGGDSEDRSGESIGGSSPVDKQLAPGLQPQRGLPLTFTVFITNDGYTTMTVAPLVDRYEPAWITFSYAVPPPDGIDVTRGVLTWTDVTSWTGDIPPHGVISVTTVFTALKTVTNTINQVEVVHAQDWYSNDLAGGSDLVPIKIVEPTPVELLYFHATEVAVSHVRLAWATGVEIDNVGFNLYRAPTSVYAQAERIAFVPARGGGTYTYDDDVDPAETTWWYWLVDVDTAGVEHVPVRTSVTLTLTEHRLYLPLLLRW
jgi:hypothetical protein